MMKRSLDYPASQYSRPILNRSNRTVADLDWVLILHNFKILYVQTPKAACTKICSLLILLARGYDDPELTQFLKDIKPAPYYHWEFGITDNRSVSDQELSNLFQNRDYFKFTFVRNPYDRLVSAYTNKVYDAPLKGNAYYTDVAKKIKAEINWHPQGLISAFLARTLNQIDNAISRGKKSDSVIRPRDAQTSILQPGESYDYAGIETRIKANYSKRIPNNTLSKALTQLKILLLNYPKLESINIKSTPVSFEEFIKFVCRQKTEVMDVHWRTQTSITGLDFVKYDFIGKVENLAPDLEYMFNKIRAPEFMYRHIKDKMNVTNKQEKIFYTDELANMVYEKYKSDFEAFGYDRFSYKK